MAKIIIVDKNDNQIGAKERHELDCSKDITRFSALWITNSRREILLSKRKFSKKENPGKWMPAAGGSVEEKETYESNIYKEAKEELGITNLPFKTGPKFFFKTPSQSFCHIFFLTLDQKINQFKLQEDEIEQVKWVDRQDLEEEINTSPEKFTEATLATFDYLYKYDA